MRPPIRMRPPATPRMRRCAHDGCADELQLHADEQRTASPLRTVMQLAARHQNVQSYTTRVRRTCPSYLLLLAP
jgi:hypothetical protein